MNSSFGTQILNLCSFCLPDRQAGLTKKNQKVKAVNARLPDGQACLTASRFCSSARDQSRSAFTALCFVQSSLRLTSLIASNPPAPTRCKTTLQGRYLPLYSIIILG
jgi:hypothetical protein